MTVACECTRRHDPQNVADRSADPPSPPGAYRGPMALPERRRDGSLVTGVVLGAVGVVLVVFVVQAVLGAVFGFAVGVAKLVVLAVVVGAVFRLAASRLG